MSQISIKSSACNAPELRIQRKIVRNGNKNCTKKIVSISKFCGVTYLDFLHAGIIHDGALNKKVSRKSI